jgi:hypothetical protein
MDLVVVLVEAGVLLLPLQEAQVHQVKVTLVAQILEEAEVELVVAEQVLLVVLQAQEIMLQTVEQELPLL